MAVYEVFVPAESGEGFDKATTVTTDSWTEALRNGFEATGIEGDMTSVLCDITAEGIDCTVPATGQTFRICEQKSGEEAPAQAAKEAPVEAAEEAPAQAAKEAPVEAVEAAPVEAAAKSGPVQGAPPAAPPAPIRSAPPRAPGSVASEEGGPGTEPTALRDMEEIYADLLEETSTIYNCGSIKVASSFILDLAARIIPAEAGAVFISDINRNDLVFSAAIGAKADDVMEFRVPMGAGIVGFCAQEGVSLAISDANNDERFYKKISESVGYKTYSILCSPVQHKGRVLGALELINRKDGGGFTHNEIAALNFLAHEFSQYLVNTGQTGD
jgi:putative methionine-R-sulfoxide reductase with GAF domain